MSIFVFGYTPTFTRIKMDPGSPLCGVRDEENADPYTRSVSRMNNLPRERGQPCHRENVAWVTL